MNYVECLALVIIRIRSFLPNFINFVLLSFLFPIYLFIEVASTTLRPIQKLGLLHSFLFVFFLFLSPEIVVRMVNSLRQVQRNLLRYLFGLALRLFRRSYRWLSFRTSWGTHFALSRRRRFGSLPNDATFDFCFSNDHWITLVDCWLCWFRLKIDWIATHPIVWQSRVFMNLACLQI
jgi:hypothetical protein